MKKLYLVDVSSMYFRAFYAIRPLSNAAGMPTNALYGFLSMTTKLLKQIQPDYLAFCFDNKEPSFRHEIYSEYKANRSEMPEDLVPQVPYVKKIAEVLGIPCFSKPGYEADDLIGALTEYGRRNDLEVVIVSGDKDFAQLVRPFVTMYDTMKDVRYDEQGVQDKWGIPASQVIDYLALVGDSSDNVPGVRGIGPKGAQKLLAEYGSLENIYASLDRIANKNLATKLAAAKDMAYLSKKLVTIATGIDVARSLDELKLREVHREDLLKLLEELGFKSFEKNLLGASPPQAKTVESAGEPGAAAPPAAGMRMVSESEFSEEEIDAERLDREVSPGQELWGFWSERGLFFAAGKKVYRFQGSPEGAGEVLSRKAVRWSGYDLKNLWKSLKIKNPVAIWDQMLAAYVLRAGEAEPFGDLYGRYTGGKLPELPSASQQVACHYLLREVLERKLAEKNGLSVLHDLELPLIPVLYEMEERGILVDLAELSAQSKELTRDIQALEKAVHEEAGEIFNVASTKQLSYILFEKMGISPLKKIKTGFSTDNDVLEKLAAEHKIAKLVIEFRELSKLKSTYVDALPLLVNSRTGRIHTHFNQAHTATGRLSSHDPNLQNIPIRTERGNRVRRAFIAEEGKCLVSLDYSQIELRILAHISGDAALCRAFEQDLDIHSATASQIYGVDVAAVTADQRRNAKAVNFGIAYGQGAFGLAENLGISRKDATDIIGRYFGQFPKVRDYMVDIVERGKKSGYVETIFGRRRYLDELSSKNGAIRKFGERAAINAPVQGTASDIVKKAMIEVAKKGLPGLLLQVHDELLFEVPIGEAEAVRAQAKDAMEKVVALKVPLKVQSARGANWEEAHA